jgi:WhiB family redox-sensing transcriptional regulator
MSIDDRISIARSTWGFSAPDRQPWMAEGVCGSTDPEAFFPDKGGSTRIAKRICIGCPVVAECLQYALDNDERFGVWGGYSERERRQLRRGVVVKRSLTNKPNRKANGHGYACKCLECRPRVVPA